jgi:hypothetical protein
MGNNHPMELSNRLKRGELLNCNCNIYCFTRSTLVSDTNNTVKLINNRTTRSSLVYFRLFRDLCGWFVFRSLDDSPRCCGVGRRWQVAEFARDQIGHEDEVAWFSISSGARLGGLD